MISINKSERTEYGVVKKEDEYIFTVALNAVKSAEVAIYSAEGSLLFRSELTDLKLAGNVYSFSVKGIEIDTFQYEYIVDGNPYNDPYMREHSLKREYGAKAKDTDIDRAVYRNDIFDWNNDKKPYHDMSDVILYQLHVRGFTKHSSSKVKAKGTFAGIIEKIPYLQSLGINQIELMPSCEFYEIDSEIDRLGKDYPGFTTDTTLDGNGNIVKNEPSTKINYWGYKKAYYFTPKSSYAYSDDAVKEFKSMVKALHAAGIEVIMQMYFTRNESAALILDCLRFWSLEYHVDGFHLMGENIPVQAVVNDAFLSDTKLYINNYDTGSDYLSESSSRFVTDVNNGFMMTMRSFLKSDGNSLNGFINAFRKKPVKPYTLNYITCYEGFTLNDLVSYDVKHNELNGENNSDGTDYNLSWNCGAEGKCSKKAVKDLRIRQIKNALFLLYMSQGTPMIFMGDEMMNSQDGNNNPYCQDNETSWINWKLNKSGEEILNYTKQLIAYRKEHGVLKQKSELKGMDYLSVSNPDISYHQDMAWKSDFNSYLLHIGIMLYGDYAKKSDGADDDTLYLAYNMHWDNHVFGLPRLKNMKWEYVSGTCTESESEELIKSLNTSQDEISVFKRSAVILKAVKDERKSVNKKSLKKDKAFKEEK